MLDKLFLRQPSGAMYVEDYFSTDLYTSSGTQRLVENGIPLGSGPSSTAWIATLGASNYDVYQSVKVDGSGNVYVCGNTNSVGQGAYDALIAQYNSAGVLQWQRMLGDAGSNYFYDLAIDGSGNSYVCGTTGSTPDGLIAKYSSTGVLSVQRLFAGASLNKIALDSSGNIYVAGSAGASSTSDAFVAKLNSSFTLLWQRTLAGSGTESYQGLSVTSAGDVYVAGNTSSGLVAGGSAGLLAKYDTSGALQWQVQLDGSGAEYFYGSQLDGSGNLYVCGTTTSQGAGSSDFLIAKYNSSGTLQWQTAFGSSAYDIASAIAVDSSGNSYVTGYSYGNDGLALTKFDTSGALQWARVLNDSLVQYGTGVAVSGSSVYVAGYNSNTASGNPDALVARLPTDGTGIGSVGSLTYTPVTHTVTTTTLTAVSTSLSSSASSLSLSIPTLTAAVATLTANTATMQSITPDGGLVWIKSRSATDHALYDTVRGATLDLTTASNAAQVTQPTGLVAFTTKGFAVGLLAKLNTSSSLYTAWTFRRSPKFFDVVTWTGNGTAGRKIAHKLGVAPGFIITKCTSSSSTNWVCYHRSAGNTQYVNLNEAGGFATYDYWNNTSPSSSDFTVGAGGFGNVNVSGSTYVAYLFAHDTSVNGLVQCGSFTTNSSGVASVNLGWEPQWILAKPASGDWWVVDNMRGLSVGANTALLFPNTTTAESAGAIFFKPNATGFDAQNCPASSTVYYVAIRRGPMKTPTSASSVFSPITYTAAAGTARITGFPVDLQIKTGRAAGYWRYFVDRLRGVQTDFAGSATPYFSSTNNLAEATDTTMTNGWGSLGYSDASIFDGISEIDWNFRRAPGFFDIVCYTGSGAAGLTVKHSLGVTPEMVIALRRDSLGNRHVCHSGFTTGISAALALNSSAGTDTGNLTGLVSATSTSFVVPNTTNLNNSASPYIAYLFASCPGISKVGSYTGSGGSQTINCGFTNGARFVLIKRRDATGDWYVWDTARGIVDASDPRLSLNTATAEVATDDSVDPSGVGFIVNQNTSTNINVSGAVYLFYAVA